MNIIRTIAKKYGKASAHDVRKSAPHFGGFTPKMGDSALDAGNINNPQKVAGASEMSFSHHSLALSHIFLRCSLK